MRSCSSREVTLHRLLRALGQSRLRSRRRNVSRGLSRLRRPPGRRLHRLRHHRRPSQLQFQLSHPPCQQCTTLGRRRRPSCEDDRDRGLPRPGPRRKRAASSGVTHLRTRRNDRRRRSLPHHRWPCAPRRRPEASLWGRCPKRSFTPRLPRLSDEVEDSGRTPSTPRLRYHLVRLSVEHHSLYSRRARRRRGLKRRIPFVNDALLRLCDRELSPHALFRSRHHPTRNRVCERWHSRLHLLSLALSRSDLVGGLRGVWGRRSAMPCWRRNFADSRLSKCEQSFV